MRSTALYIAGAIAGPAGAQREIESIEKEINRAPATRSRGVRPPILERN